MSPATAHTVPTPGAATTFLIFMSGQVGRAIRVGEGALCGRVPPERAGRCCRAGRA